MPLLHPVFAITLSHLPISQTTITASCRRMVSEFKFKKPTIFGTQVTKIPPSIHFFGLLVGYKRDRANHYVMWPLSSGLRPPVTTWVGCSTPQFSRVCHLRWFSPYHVGVYPHRYQWDMDGMPRPVPINKPTRNDFEKVRIMLSTTVVAKVIPYRPQWHMVTR